MKNNDTQSNIVMNVSENFKFTGRNEVDSAMVLSAEDTYMDSRMAMISYNTDFSNLKWYYNYLDAASYFARNNPNAYPQYLLQLGYIPVVYLPSCITTLGAKLTAIIDSLNIPSVRMRATSFVLPYYQSDKWDVWVSKIHLGQYFGVAPETVRSAEVVRRLFDGD